MNSTHSSLIENGFDRFIKKYNEPAFDFNVNVARLFVCSFLIWKLLSRDFGFFGTLPEGIFYFYPVQLYPLTTWVDWTGLPVLMELLTFHWIHWFLPHPTEFVLRLVQGSAIAALVLLAIVGNGPKKLILAYTYCVLIYLWGYLFLLGQEIDAISMYFGLLVALFISNYRDVSIWRLRALYHSPKTVNGGRSCSNLILVFVFYYFASGIKKLTDLSPLDWFRYDLIEAIQYHSISAAAGPLGSYEFFRYLHGMTWLDYVGPPLVYVSHLLVPTIFFKRRSIFNFFVFYALFHFMAFGVGISFTGYIFIWFAIVPHRQMIAAITNWGGSIWTRGIRLRDPS